ncbi:uncharacterized protein C8Q71DRAFT_908915 [Rhodofomes roseus]|uniref:Uncharacterized protein n=1 Tax=Rhodofomes roseus TaxID=34475 RepID=A0ABQ8KB56_9APHY|nr:uncharacterized protein C8Q71DRAFT_908915 [Rhodofomes roseus]KAH9834494.1 hypothetical protein C8Q71DRAFT_908915 [Rhodofomes roseus]
MSRVADKPAAKAAAAPAFRWKNTVTSTLRQHVRFLSVWVSRLPDHDLECEQYHFLDVSLNFIAARMLPDGAEYMVSVHPQAPFRAPSAIANIEEPGPTQDSDRAFTRHYRAANIEVEVPVEPVGADDDVLMMEDDLHGHQSLSHDPMAEVSFTTDVTEVGPAPKEKVSYPDFATIISFMEADALEVEEHVLFLHEVKRYPPRFFRLTNAAAKNHAITEAMNTQAFLKQTSLQAYRAFNEYPGDDRLHVMLHIGIYFRVATFDRKRTQKFVKQFANMPRGALWEVVPTRISQVKCMFNAIFNDDGSVVIEEYGRRFKTWMSTTRGDRVAAYEEARLPPGAKGKKTRRKKGKRS